MATRHPLRTRRPRGGRRFPFGFLLVVILLALVSGSKELLTQAISHLEKWKITEAGW